jgi:predicted TIM-barrel fold metal-dependent hydrolase
MTTTADASQPVAAPTDRASDRAVPPAAMASKAPPAPPGVFAPAIEKDYNRTGVNFRAPMPRPKVRGHVIDAHCHLFTARHASTWFEAAAHYGIDRFITMTPLEEALTLARDWPGRLHFIAVPRWRDPAPNVLDDWLRRIESFYNLGSRIAKFHMAPATMEATKLRLDSPTIRRVMDELVARKMAIMTHVGDPDTWYCTKYTDCGRYGARDEQYKMWEEALEAYRGHPWLGAHLGGNPENLPRLQYFLDKFPDLWLDCSATRWMVREISAHRDAARDFFIRNADRILFGSDQVSGDDRNFDFYASRFWCHRKLWETAYTGPSPIFDPDLPDDHQPPLRGLALPDEVLQKIYHDNATKFLATIGMPFDDA